MKSPARTLGTLDALAWAPSITDHISRFVGYVPEHVCTGFAPAFTSTEASDLASDLLAAVENQFAAVDGSVSPSVVTRSGRAHCVPTLSARAVRAEFADLAVDVNVNANPDADAAECSLSGGLPRLAIPIAVVHACNNRSRTVLTVQITSTEVHLMLEAEELARGALEPGGGLLPSCAVRAMLPADLNVLRVVGGDQLGDTGAVQLKTVELVMPSDRRNVLARTLRAVARVMTWTGTGSHCIQVLPHMSLQVVRATLLQRRCTGVGLTVAATSALLWLLRQRPVARRVQSLFFLALRQERRGREEEAALMALHSMSVSVVQELAANISHRGLVVACARLFTDGTGVLVYMASLTAQLAPLRTVFTAALGAHCRDPDVVEDALTCLLGLGLSAETDTDTTAALLRVLAGVIDMHPKRHDVIVLALRALVTMTNARWRRVHIRDEAQACTAAITKLCTALPPQDAGSARLYFHIATALRGIVHEMPMSFQLWTACAETVRVLFAHALDPDERARLFVVTSKDGVAVPRVPVELPVNMQLTVRTVMGLLEQVVTAAETNGDYPDSWVETVLRAAGALDFAHWLLPDCLAGLWALAGIARGCEPSNPAWDRTVDLVIGVGRLALAPSSPVEVSDEFMCTVSALLSSSRVIMGRSAARMVMGLPLIKALEASALRHCAAVTAAYSSNCLWMCSRLVYGSIITRHELATVSVEDFGAATALSARILTSTAFGGRLASVVMDAVGMLDAAAVLAITTSGTVAARLAAVDSEDDLEHEGGDGNEDGAMQPTTDCSSFLPHAHCACCRCTLLHSLDAVAADTGLTADEFVHACHIGLTRVLTAYLAYGASASAAVDCVHVLARCGVLGRGADQEAVNSLCFALEQVALAQVKPRRCAMLVQHLRGARTIEQ